MSRSADASPYGDADFAATYDRCAVPHHFSGPARDLVAGVALRPGDRVLDVGAGTGAVARRAAALVAPGGRLVALDPARAMLQRVHGSDCRRVVGRVPGLPCRDGAFDAVLASFVLSHVQRPDAALADMVRALRPGGRLGVTAWGPNVAECARLWQEISSRFVDAEKLRQEFRAVIPSDETFSDGTGLEAALRDAALADVRREGRAHSVRIPVGEYLAIREASVEGRVVRRELGPERWREFRSGVTVEFQRRFGAEIAFSRLVHFGFGRKV